MEFLKMEPWDSMAGHRKMTVAGIIMQAVTMVLQVRDSDSFGHLAVSLPGPSSEGWTHGTYWFGQSAATGFQMHPLAPLVLLGLYVMFGTAKYNNPWWAKHGYKVTIPAMLFLTTGGAPFRVFGGFINLVGFLFVCFAAYQHHRWLKQNNGEPVKLNSGCAVIVTAGDSKETDQSAAASQSPVLKPKGTRKKKVSTPDQSALPRREATPEQTTATSTENASAASGNSADVEKSSEEIEQSVGPGAPRRPRTSRKKPGS